jgi:hypothetical protein
MGMAFEITVEDVMTVSSSRTNTPLTEYQAEIIFNQLDHDAIERAALHGNDMDTQIEYAYEEIRNQLSGTQDAA